MTSESGQKTAKNAALVGFAEHAHTACVNDTLAAADKWSAENGLRFTPVRRKVLEILLQEHRALGAYAILDRLGEVGFGSQPPVAYRALDFLVLNGLAHKIEKLNAFIACAHPGQAHAPAFMICRKCDAVAETQSSPAEDMLSDAARASGFQIECTVVEAEGICPLCSNEDPA